MEIGTSLPATELGADPAAIRDFAQAAEDLGYASLGTGDHVLGADPQFHPEVPNFYFTHESLFHEPFTLMGYLAAITKRMVLGTNVVILPQRQTALVAKQAAEVDVLSGGRLRLGIGIGWNPVEFEALGQEFRTRGARFEEQVEVLRLLWTQEIVNYTGRWHKITHAGINPLPVQRPIPLWMGQGNPDRPIPPDRVLRRIGRLADGILTLFDPDEAGRDALSRVFAYAKEAGRDPASIGVRGRVLIAPGTGPEDWVNEMTQWEEAGASHLNVATGAVGLKSPQEHIDAIRRFKEQVGL